MAKTGVSHLFRMAATVALLAAGVTLSGCIGNTSLDDLDYAKPAGSPFDLALYENYSYIARSFGEVGEAKRSVFDFDGSWSLNATHKDIATLANTFAGKAVMAAQGEFVDPEPARDPASHEMRDRLLRALEPARDLFPRDGARVQVDFDCWLLNGAVPAQQAAAQRCRTSLEKVLPKLEAAVSAAQAAQAAEAAKAAGGQPPQP
jgi:hypothetical protein